MRRRAARSAEESELATQLSQYLKMCRRSWDEFVRAANRKSTLLTHAVYRRDRLAEYDAAIEQIDVQIDTLEGEASRILRLLGEPPLRGRGR